MKFEAIKLGMARFAGKAAIGFSKVKPDLFVIGGVAGMAVAAVMACQATRKLDSALDEIKEDFQLAKDVRQAVKDHEEGVEGVVVLCHKETGKPYTKMDVRRCTAAAAMKAFLKLAKLYGPSIAVGVLSAASILHGFNIVKINYASAAALATGLTKTLKDYRSRVREALGDEEEERLYSGTVRETVLRPTTNENGEEVVETEIRKIARTDDPLTDPFTFIYDELTAPRNFDCRGFTNFQKLQCFQATMNTRLRNVGHVDPSDVLDEIGFRSDIVKQVLGVGWYYDPENPNLENCIDFGFDEYEDGKNERSFRLRFNPDGYLSVVSKKADAHASERDEKAHRSIGLSKLKDRWKARRAVAQPA